MLASPAAPASLHALLSHLFASRFAHPFVYRLLRRRLPMTLPRRIDWSTAEALVDLIRFGGRWVAPVIFVLLFFSKKKMIDVGAVGNCALCSFP